MGRHSKSLLALILALVFMSGIASFNAAAADYTSLVEEVGYVLDYIDSISSDVSVINNRQTNFMAVTADSLSADAVAPLMTAEFIAACGGENAAKEAIAELLSKSIAVYSSSNKDILAASLSNAEDAIENLVQDLFGVSADKWLEFFLLSKKNMQDVVMEAKYWETRYTWACGPLPELIAKIDRIHAETIKRMLSDDADFGAAFKQYGWTADALVAVCRNISNVADEGHLAEMAMTKAAARTSVKLTVDGAVKELKFAGKDLTAEENVVNFVPSDLPKELVISFASMGIDVTNVVACYTSNENVVEFSRNAEDMTITANLKAGAQGTADIALCRAVDIESPAVSADWIVRFRVVVKDELAAPKNVAWVVENEKTTPVLSWQAGDENAESYTVVLYKDGAKKKTVTTNKTTYDFSSIITESGSYTAEVTAHGDIEEEVSDTVATEVPHIFTATLAKVEKPVWNTETEEISWNGVDGAVKYIVKLYDASNPNAIYTVEVDAAEGVNKLDLSEQLKDKTGSFYVTVQAKGEGIVLGDVSDKSETLEKYRTASGLVKLQTAQYESRLAGKGEVTVTVKELPGKVVLTDENGNYTIDGLKEGVTYTLYFDSQCYLRTAVKVKVEGSAVVAEDALLYYGDFNGDKAVGSYDLTYISARVNTSAGEPAYDSNPVADIGGDGITIDELSLVVINAGKVTEE